jgi:ribonuclease G
VGEKRLVRIEEAGRTAATAVLVDEPDEEDVATPDAAENGDGDDGVESSARRRGRRGGRRRSRATAESSATPAPES